MPCRRVPIALRDRAVQDVQEWNGHEEPSVVSAWIHMLPAVGVGSALALFLVGCSFDNPAVYERANQDLDGIQLGLFGVVMLIVLFALLRTPDTRRRRPRGTPPLPERQGDTARQHLAQAILRSTAAPAGSDRPPPRPQAPMPPPPTRSNPDNGTVLIELRDEDRWMPPPGAPDATLSAVPGLLEWELVEHEYAACLAAETPRRFISSYAPLPVRRVGALAEQLEICDSEEAPFWLLRRDHDGRVYLSLDFAAAHRELFRNGDGQELRQRLRGVFHVDRAAGSEIQLVYPAAVRVSDRQMRVVSPGLVVIPGNTHR